jgi:hypothetical protein
MGLRSIAPGTQRLLLLLLLLLRLRGRGRPQETTTTTTTAYASKPTTKTPRESPKSPT